VQVEAGIDAVMAGYGALRNPSMFAPHPAPLDEMLERYLSVAVLHEQKLIDVLRHVFWLVKGDVSPEIKPRIFQVQDLLQLQAVLLSMSCPIRLSLPTVARRSHRIDYPKQQHELEGLELKKYYRQERRRASVEDTETSGPDLSATEASEVESCVLREEDCEIWLIDR